jgi:hypothetical protein
LIDDVIAAGIGGLVNLGVNLAEGHVHNVWQGLGYFGAGAAAGDLALYGPAGWAAGGAIVGASNAALGGGNLKQVVQGGIVGGISGLAGGAAGQWVGQGLGSIVVNGTNITSPVLKGAITGVLGGMAGGYVGGFTGNLMMGGNLSTANQAGINGLEMGAAIGFSTGAVSGYKYALDNKLNPWTGAKLNAPNVNTNYNLTPDPNGGNVTLYRGTTGSEGNGGALFLTTDPAYAASYVQNGGQVIEITIPNSTFLQMQYTGDIEVLTGLNSSTNSGGMEIKVINNNLSNQLLSTSKTH